MNQRLPNSISRRRISVTSAPRRRGAVMICVCITVPAMMAVCSLGVDVAHVLFAKSQIRHAAIAAAMYGAEGLAGDSAIAQAQAAAAENNVDGTPLVLAGSDIVTGTWSRAYGFTAGGSNPNAIQIYAHRLGESGIALTWASVIGRNFCNVTAHAIASTTTNPPGGFVGYNGITFKNTTMVASYDSLVTTSPNQNNYNSHGMLGTNAALNSKNTNYLYGDAMLGPGASTTGINITGSALYQASNLVPPTMPTWSPGTNPGGVSQAYTVSTPTTLPGGSYWFTTLTINADLNFSGPATIYVNGPIAINANLTAAGSIPWELQVFQYGSNTFGDTAGNNWTITADVWATSSDFVTKNHFAFYGRGFFNSIYNKNAGEYYYDEEFGPASGGFYTKLVQID